MSKNRIFYNFFKKTFGKKWGRLKKIKMGNYVPKTGTFPKNIRKAKKREKWKYSNKNFKRTSGKKCDFRNFL